jgi:hypothetical protein
MAKKLHTELSDRTLPLFQLTDGCRQTALKKAPKEEETMRIKFPVAAAAIFALTTMPAFAQHGHGAGMHGSSATSHGNSADPKAAKGSSSNNSVSEKLTDNTKLASKLQSLLPAGTNLQMAAQGFKNLGQFVAAVHVSHNLGIPFDQLKAKMMGPPKESLGKAVQALKPAASAKDETKKAEKQAKQDLDDSSKS